MPPGCASIPRSWRPWRKPCGAGTGPAKEGGSGEQNGQDAGDDPGREERRRVRRRRKARLGQTLLGRSRGGLTCKVHLASDRRCRPLSIVVTAGQPADSPQFVPVLKKVCVRLPVGRPRTRPAAVAGDKAYPSRANRAYLRRRGIKAAIPEKKDQATHRKKRGRRGGRPVTHDADLYKDRNTVERMITEGLAGYRHPLRQDPRELRRRPPPQGLVMGGDLGDVRRWAAGLGEVHERFMHRFARSEPRESALAYMRGLIAPLERKNGWTLAEDAGHAAPDRIHRLLNRCDWDPDEVLPEVRDYVVEHLGDPEAVLIVDHMGFLKKGAAQLGSNGSTPGRRDGRRIARSASSSPMPAPVGAR